MKFTTAFIEFFNTILKTIEDCKPNINRINDDEHYPNAAKLEKYYQTLNKLTDDQMNGFKFKLELIHKMEECLSMVVTYEKIINKN